MPLVVFLRGALWCSQLLLFSPLQLLGLPDADDDAFEEYSADVEEEEPEADHPQMGVSQQ